MCVQVGCEYFYDYKRVCVCVCVSLSILASLFTSVYNFVCIKFSINVSGRRILKYFRKLFIVYIVCILFSNPAIVFVIHLHTAGTFVLVCAK